MQSTAALAQTVPVGDPLEDYARLLQMTGKAPVSSFSARPMTAAQLFGESGPIEAHPWQRFTFPYTAPKTGIFRYGLFDPELRAYWNSARPSGQNDGAVWQGRGNTFVLSAGGFFLYGAFSAALRPQVIYTQNTEFELSPWFIPETRSPYSYPLNTRIDLPQRFGPDPYWELDLGQSYARLDYWGVAFGFSNENLWWGPAVRNPIIMSNNAPGFRHVFLGTSGPADIWVGNLQAHWVWGSLRESGYFDFEAENDRRFLTGMVVDFSPRWIPELTLGATRVFVGLREEGLDFSELFLVTDGLVKDNSRLNEVGNDEYDQMASIFGQWRFPESGAEIYGEFARGDHSQDLRDLVLEPEHGSGYTVGFQKAFELSPVRQLRLTAEQTNLEARKTAFQRNADPNSTFFYTHSVVQQGYTQRGQVIGASIGPGGSAQYLGLDLFAPWGKVGVFGLRNVLDNDRYYRLFKRWERRRHEVELGGGVRGLIFIKGFELAGALAYEQMLNRYYTMEDDRVNLRLTFSVRRSLMGFR